MRGFSPINAACSFNSTLPQDTIAVFLPQFKMFKVSFFVLKLQSIVLKDLFDRGSCFALQMVCINHKWFKKASNLLSKDRKNMQELSGQRCSKRFCT